MAKALVLDEIANLPVAMRSALLPLAENWTPELYAWTAEKLDGDIASFEHVDEVLSRAPEFGLLLAEVPSLQQKPMFRGFTIFLPLNEVGHSSLLSGEFNGSAINPAFLATKGEPVASLYWWCTVGPSAVALGMTAVFSQLQKEHVREASIFTKPITKRAEELARLAGFEPVRPDASYSNGGLFVYHRSGIFSDHPRSIEAA